MIKDSTTPVSTLEAEQDFELFVRLALELGFESIEEFAQSISDLELRKRLLRIAYSYPLIPTKADEIQDRAED